MEILAGRQGIYGAIIGTHSELSGSADRRDNALTRYMLQEYQMNAFTVSIFLCPVQIRSPFSFPELRPLQSVCDGPANLTEAISLPFPA